MKKLAPTAATSHPANVPGIFNGLFRVFFGLSFIN
jgi:hypothetical protein